MKSKRRSQLRRDNNIKQPQLAQSLISACSLHSPRLTCLSHITSCCARFTRCLEQSVCNSHWQPLFFPDRVLTVTAQRHFGTAESASILAVSLTDTLALFLIRGRLISTSSLEPRRVHQTYLFIGIHSFYHMPRNSQIIPDQPAQDQLLALT
jgi:hypothetical protein